MATVHVAASEHQILFVIERSVDRNHEDDAVHGDKRRRFFFQKKRDFRAVG